MPNNNNPKKAIQDVDTKATGSKPQKPARAPSRQSSIDAIMKLLKKIHEAENPFKKNPPRRSLYTQFKMKCHIWGKSWRRTAIIVWTVSVFMVLLDLFFKFLNLSFTTTIACYLIILVSAVLWVHLGLRSRRNAELGLRIPEGQTAFIHGVLKISPGVPSGFILTVRKALAIAYCVPEDIISYQDNEKSLSKLHTQSSPLAIELLYGVCVLSDIEPDIEMLYELAARYERAIPDSVPQLIGVVYNLLHEDCEQI